MKHLRIRRTLFLVALCFVCTGAFAQQQQAIDEERGLVDFYIAPWPNYRGAQWILNEHTDKIIGYAPWDTVQRRWLLFSLSGTYEGFIQATIGDTDPPHYTQYLWYDKHGKYRGLFVTRPGGRAASPKLPDGELGGQLIYYARGDIESVDPLYRKEVHPLRKLMHGIEPNPIDPLNTK